jgi:hypothetical protein
MTRRVKQSSEASRELRVDQELQAELERGKEIVAFDVAMSSSTS